MAPGCAEFAVELVGRRTRAGMSRRGLARAVGVTYAVMARWEAGAGQPRLRALWLLSDVLSADPTAVSGEFCRILAGDVDVVGHGVRPVSSCDTLATALRRERDELGITQRRLARLSGVVQSSVHRYEHGDPPMPAALWRLAAVFCHTDREAVEWCGAWAEKIGRVWNSC